MAVTTLTMELVLAAPYDYGSSYTVSEPFEPGEKIPDQSRYDDSVWNAARTGSPGAISILVVSTLFLIGILVGAFLGIRTALKHG